MKWLSIDIAGRAYRVPAIKAAGKLWFHWQGETHAVDLPGAARRGGKEAGKAHPGVLAAPMPGKVTRLSVRLGDRVTKGQTIVVMEAMKMEYTLEADRDGVVTEVNVFPGMQVTLAQVMVRLGDPPAEEKA